MGSLSIRTMFDPKSGQRLTTLDCQVGNHTGYFPITKLPDGRWACPKHGGRS